SFDDDGPTGWSAPSYEVPVNSVSFPRGYTYGSTTAKDEIIFVKLRKSLNGYPSALFATADVLPGYSESSFDSDLAPNPDMLPTDEVYDNDIDALFAFDVNPPFLFSADSEAPYGLNPGSIYQANAGYMSSWALTEVANAQTKLKLKSGTD